MKKRGISLISLSIAIVILLALVSTITISLTYSVNNAKKMAFAKEIYNIQSIVNENIERDGILSNTLESIEIEPSNAEQFAEETLNSGKLLLDTLDLQGLGLNSTSYGNKEIGSSSAEKTKDVYAVSQATGKVYYIAGIEIGSKKYYTLTDELRQMIEKEQNLNVSEESITFTSNKSGWSSEAVAVTVTVPADFTSPSISINNSNISYTTSTSSGVTYYSVNTSNVAENYTITVNYTKGGVTSSATYTAKIDKTAPVISKKASVENTAGKINGLAAVDSESGIKYFKYVEDKISAEDVKSYVYAYGKDISNGSINFTNKQTYTLYAEDKVGNYSVVYLIEDGTLVQE